MKKFAAIFIAIALILSLTAITALANEDSSDPIIVTDIETVYNSSQSGKPVATGNGGSDGHKYDVFPGIYITTSTGIWTIHAEEGVQPGSFKLFFTGANKTFEIYSFTVTGPGSLDLHEGTGSEGTANWKHVKNGSFIPADPSEPEIPAPEYVCEHEGYCCFCDECDEQIADCCEDDDWCGCEVCEPEVTKPEETTPPTNPPEHVCGCCCNETEDCDGYDDCDDDDWCGCEVCEPEVSNDNKENDDNNDGGTTTNNYYGGDDTYYGGDDTGFSTNRIILSAVTEVEEIELFDEELPLAELPEEEFEEEFFEEEIPLTELLSIEDVDVPLAELPQTGLLSIYNLLFLLGAMFAGSGIVLGVKGSKKASNN